MLDFLEYLIEVFEPRRYLSLYHRLHHLYLGGVRRHFDPLHLKKQFLLDFLETCDFPLHSFDFLSNRLLLLSRLLQCELLVLQLLESLVQVLLLLMYELPVIVQVLLLLSRCRRFLLLILLLFFRGYCWGA